MGEAVSHRALRHRQRGHCVRASFPCIIKCFDQRGCGHIMRFPKTGDQSARTGSNHGRHHPDKVIAILDPDPSGFASSQHNQGATETHLTQPIQRQPAISQPQAGRVGMSTIEPAMTGDMEGPSPEWNRAPCPGWRRRRPGTCPTGIVAAGVPLHRACLARHHRGPRQPASDRFR